MQFVTALFGGAENTILTSAFALGIVLVLILLGLWALKFVMQTSTAMTRGRNRRLMVVESLQLDTRHKVTIIRRDNVEHVIMTGGAQDVVIESGIPVEKLGIRRPAPAQPQPTAAAAPTPPRPVEEPRPAMRTPMERLRDAGRSATQRKAPSLRNTGLLRSIPRSDGPVIPMNGYNSDAGKADSAKTGAVTETNAQAKLGAASSRSLSGDAFKAEGK